jgi:pSer/pThr/pTyr-binding forkhead associated (FHA) protein
MQVVLVMFRSDGERRSFSVVRNITVIGRREDCDLRIPVGDVSRKHCRILTGDDGVRVEDLGSSNGTFVNHERVQQSDLNPGDTLGVGPVQFVVQIDGVPDDDELTAPTAAAPVVSADDSSAEYQAPTLVDELPAEEEVLEETPLEEVAEEEIPAAELPEEDLLEEAEPLEEAPLEELEVAEAPMEEPVELEELEEPVIAEDELEEAPLAAGHTEAEPLEELEVEAKAPEPEPVAEDELEELHLTPPSHVEETIEELELDGDEAEAGGNAAEGSAWDFVIEETETERAPHELHVDLDAPHQQPHQ